MDRKPSTRELPFRILRSSGFLPLRPGSRHAAPDATCRSLAGPRVFSSARSRAFKGWPGCGSCTRRVHGLVCKKRGRCARSFPAVGRGGTVQTLTYHAVRLRPPFAAGGDGADGAARRMEPITSFLSPSLRIRAPPSMRRTCACARSGDLILLTIALLNPRFLPGLALLVELGWKLPAGPPVPDPASPFAFQRVCPGFQTETVGTR